MIQLIQSDASKTSWEASCQKTIIGGVWSQVDLVSSINILELRAAQFVIPSFCQYKNFKYHGRHGFQGKEKFVKQMDKLKFQRLLHALRPVHVDLFVSRLC